MEQTNSRADDQQGEQTPATEDEAPALSDAEQVLECLCRRGWTIAAAESLTGGLVASALVEAPGASAVVRGGVVAYATEAKQTLLGVDADLLAAEGPVHPRVAEQMATGVRTLFSADVGVATTGVAGPEPQDGKPVGTVYVAVVTPERSEVIALDLDGTRDEIRRETVRRLLSGCHPLL